MVVQFNVKNPADLQKGSILIFDGKSFEAISINALLEQVNKENERLAQELKTLKKGFKEFKLDVAKKQVKFMKSFVSEGSNSKGDDEE